MGLGSQQQMRLEPHCLCAQFHVGTLTQRECDKESLDVALILILRTLTVCLSAARGLGAGGDSPSPTRREWKPRPAARSGIRTTPYGAAEGQRGAAWVGGRHACLCRAGVEKVKLGWGRVDDTVQCLLLVCQAREMGDGIQ